MTICYFGIYDPNYCRNKNLIEGLRQSGVKVIEINDRTPSLLKYWRLIRKHSLVRNDYDLMIVGFCGQAVMPLAWLITHGPIVFDAHTSLYDGNINQKKLFSPRSPAAWFYYALDWLSCRLADVILLDTREHIKYFVETFRVPAKKFLAVYNGTDNSLFHQCPAKESGAQFVVEFHAHVTLLHGFKYILEAMKILQDRGEPIKLLCVAKGLEWEGFDRLKKYALEDLKLTNVDFIKPMPPATLWEEVFCRSDIGLGIFGKNSKVDRVIPNKVYELMASGLPVITADSPAMREKFRHLEEAYLIPKGDTAALAEAIIALKNNPDLRQRIAAGALAKINSELTPKAMADNFLNDLKKYRL